MDGFSATLSLRSKGYRGPIIALTANAGERDRDKCLNAGCNDFVTKPIKLEMLFKAMGRYLTVEQVKDEPTEKLDASSTVSPETTSRQFMEKLPEELEQIEQAIERQDRVRLTEVVQLIVGTASALGLKDCVAEAGKLLQMAKAEPSWVVLRTAAGDFAEKTQGNAEAKAA
jgi:response regulator RpfG family c-di-GMP phosphodiesterase